MAGEKFTFQIERDELRQIKQAAKARNMSASEFVRTACKEKIDTQSVVLPILFETRDALGTRMTELERIVKTNCALFERAQEGLNDALATRLIEGNIRALADLKARMANEFDKTDKTRDAAFARLEKTLGTQGAVHESNYKRLKRIEESVQKQADNTWSKKFSDALAKPKS